MDFAHLAGERTVGTVNGPQQGIDVRSSASGVRGFDATRKLDLTDVLARVIPKLIELAMAKLAE